jgi:hypothetical protein
MADISTSTLLGLTQAVKHFNNPIAEGVADTVITVAPFYELVPFIPVRGSSLIVNQDATTGMVGFSAEGNDLTTDTAVSKPMSTTQRTFVLKALLGQANVDRFSASTSAAAGVDQMALQVAAKSRNIARKAYEQVAKGSTAGDTAGFDGLPELRQQSANSGTAFDLTSAVANTFSAFDAAMNLVTSKDGQIDFIMCSSNVIDKYKAAVRATGSGFDYFTSPITNRNILAYEGVPVLRNDYLAGFDEQGGVSNTQEAIYAGCFEDGGNNGLSMIYPEGTPAGIDVRALGESEIYNADITRVAMYTGVALHNDKGLAVAYATV